MVGVPTNGNDKRVGILFIPPTSSRPPLRILYPADCLHDSHAKATQVGWFHDTGGAVAFLRGYAHVALAKLIPTSAFRYLVQPAVSVVALCLPMTWLTIPGLYHYPDSCIVSDHDAEAVYHKETQLDENNHNNHNNTQKQLPLIVFSHGLTGTGQENLALCTAWARQGYVVVGVHHTDGSSCAVPRADGSIHYYDHGPSFDDYDATFRPRQLQQRTRELLDAYQFITQITPSTTDMQYTNPNNNNKINQKQTNHNNDSSILSQLRALVDPHRAIAAGFSYGAATVAQTVVHPNNPFVAAVLLDGWFYIDVPKSGVEFPLPPEAFQYVDVQKKPGGRQKGLPVPSLFLNSQEFRDYDKLYQATQRLAGQAVDTKATNDTKHPQHDKSCHEMVVLPQTGHNNFCDVIFWFPAVCFWLPALLFKGVIANPGRVGRADPLQTYQDIVDRTHRFLKQVTTE